MEKQRDWAALDEGRSFAYRKDRLEFARKHGFKYITEACCGLYQEHGVTKSAEMMGLSKEGIKYIVKYCGMPLKSHGGRRWAVLTADQVRHARKIWNGSLSSDHMAWIKSKIGAKACDDTIRKCVQRKTWADIE